MTRSDYLALLFVLLTALLTPRPGLAQIPEHVDPMPPVLVETGFIAAPGPNGAVRRPAASPYCRDLDAEATPLVAFTDVAVVSVADGRTLPHRTVIVRDGIIVAAGPSSDVAVPSDALVVRGTGKYLMPGLHDMHVHLADERDLLLFLANGVTTIRVMWGNERLLRLRDAIADGSALGPRMAVASPGFDGPGEYWPHSQIVIDAASAQNSVREMKAAGYDFIKMYNDVPENVYDEVLGAARRNRIPVVGHVPLGVRMRDVFRAGQRSIEHLSGYAPMLVRPGDWSNAAPWDSDMDPARMRTAAAESRTAGIWNCPTLTVRGRTAHAVQVASTDYIYRYASPALRAWFRSPPTQAPDWDNTRAETNARRFLKELDAAGAGLLLGTDSGIRYVMPGFSIHEELSHFVAAGLTPQSALKAGTTGAAAFLGGDPSTAGRIVEGAAADLILLNADPLDDVANVQRRSGVMVNGRWLPESWLRTMLERRAMCYRDEEPAGGT